MLLHDSSSLKDPCIPTPWHLFKTPSVRPLAKEHAQLVATAALFCTVSSRFSVAPHIQAINHGFRVKLDHKNVSYYGPLRRATEVPGHAEQVKSLIALQKETGNAHAKRSIGRLQQGEQPQGAKNRPSQRYVRGSLDRHRRGTWRPQRQFRMGEPDQEQTDSKVHTVADTLGAANAPRPSVTPRSNQPDQPTPEMSSNPISFTLQVIRAIFD